MNVTSSGNDQGRDQDKMAECPRWGWWAGNYLFTSKNKKLGREEVGLDISFDVRDTMGCLYATIAITVFDNVVSGFLSSSTFLKSTFGTWNGSPMA